MVKEKEKQCRMGAGFHKYQQKVEPLDVSMPLTICMQLRRMIEVWTSKLNEPKFAVPTMACRYITPSADLWQNGTLVSSQRTG
jgi:hypothetical protein